MSKIKPLTDLDILFSLSSEENGISVEKENKGEVVDETIPEEETAPKKRVQIRRVKAEEVGRKFKQNVYNLPSQRKVFPRVEIPEQLYKDIKKEAAEKGVSTDQLVTECLEEGFTNLYRHWLRR